jgi:predicted RNA-binding protein with EMAP domain
MRKYRNIPKFEFEEKEYVTAEDFKDILDDIEQIINTALNNMDSGFRYVQEAYDELEQLSLDLY